MAILRNKTQDSYTNVSNEILRDTELKLFDRGLLITLMGLPNNWNLTARGMASIVPEGRDAIQNSINRLVEQGYLKCYQERTPDGKMGHNFMEICVPKCSPKENTETKNQDKEPPAVPKEYKTNDVFKPFAPCPENPDTVNPDTVNPDTANPDTMIPYTEISSTDKLNNNKSNTNQYIDSSSNKISDWMMTKRIDVDALTRSFDTDTVNDVCGVIDLIYSDSSKNVYSVNSSKTAKADIRKLFEEKLNQEQLQEVLERLKDSKPTKIVAKDSYYLTILFNQLQNFRTTTGPPRHLAGAHNFQERTDTDWEELELKLLMKDSKP